MLTLSRFARVASLSSVGSQENSDFVRSKSITSRKTNGTRLLPWRTKDTIWVPALLLMNLFTLLEVSLAALSRRLTILLKCMKLKKINGKCSLSEWRTHSGPAAPWPFLTVKSYSLAVRTRTETVRCTCSTWTQRTGSHCITWISWGSATNPSSSKTRSTLLAVTTICRVRSMT